MDWYTFNSSTAVLTGGTAQPSTISKPVMITPVTFRGMPARRFWEMEDGGTNVAQLSAAAEDLGRLLLRDFALIYGNDWFQFPLTAPVGSQVEVTSLTVADTFGIPTLIPHYSAMGGGNWRMFSISSDTPGTAAAVVTPHSILIAPNAIAPVNGPVIEEVLLLRDELANTVWGIERTVVGASGQPVDRTTAWNTSLAMTPPPAGAMPTYRLGSDVPDFWIPFIPVPSTTAGSSLLLQRAQMPTAKTGPLGSMLSEAKTMFLEEVPREGVLLERRYRLARGVDGVACLWLGRRRFVGKGEGRSGLRFDFLE